jgi:hypothetical protein
MTAPMADVQELLDVIVTAQRALGAARRRLEALPPDGQDPLPGLEVERPG